MHAYDQINSVNVIKSLVTNNWLEDIAVASVKSKIWVCRKLYLFN